MVSNTIILMMVILALVLLGISLYIGMSVLNYTGAGTAESGSGRDISLVVNPQEK